MAATIIDLQIIQREDGPWFAFRWDGSREEWRAALEAVKSQIPPEAREFDEDEKLWRVSADFEPQLSAIFRNFDGAIDGVRSQVSLF